MPTARPRAKEALPVHHQSRAALGASSWLSLLAWFFIALGSALRLAEYLANRSLSIDESYLALNLIQKSPSELLRTLDFNQAAPIGFLQVEKLIITVFTRSEYFFRLLPLLTSLGTLMLFYLIAREVFRPLAAVISVATFSLLDPLIYYAATAKQYAFDVLAAVVILAIVFALERRVNRSGDLLALSVFGVLLVWFSHASVFALGGLALLLAVRWFADRDWRHAAVLVAMVGVWSASFAIEFMLTRSNLAGIVGSIEPASGTLLAPSDAGGSWFDRSIDRVRYLVGLEDTASGDPVLASLPSEVNRGLTILILVVAGAGFVSLLLRHTSFAIVLGTGPVLAVIASAVHQYPLVGRTLLFALPFVALCLGEGARAILELGMRRKTTAIPAAIVALSLAGIAILPVRHAFAPRSSQEMKQALAFLGMRHRSHDTLYVSAQAQYAFAYYHLCGCSEFDPYTVWRFSTTGGRDQRARAVQTRSPNLIIAASAAEDRGAEMQSLLGRSRVWILFADDPDHEKEPVLNYLDRRGERLQTFQASGPSSIAASLYLYELRNRG